MENFFLIYSDFGVKEGIESLATLTAKFFVKVRQFETSISEMGTEKIKELLK